MVAGLCGVLLVLPGAGHLSQALFRSRAYTTGVALILAVTYFEMLFQMAVLYLQSELRSVLYVSAHTARLVLAIAPAQHVALNREIDRIG